MAGRQFDVSVLVRLRDALSAPLAGLQRKLAGLSNFASRIGVLSGLIASISFAAPIASAAAFDAQLRDIGITAGLSGGQLEASIAEMSQRFGRLAIETAQTSKAVASAAGVLVAAGMDTKQIDKLLPAIARVATASGAATDDIAKTAFALSDALQVPADQMDRALAALVVAGKQGRFELSEMARYFPALTAQMSQLGVTGMEAVKTLGAGLQIAMQGAPDPSTAANNMQNFLAKLLSPETIANFKKKGVDIGAVMTDAVAKGINPIEAVLQKVSKLTGVSSKDVAKAFDTAKKAGLSDAAALQKVEEQVRRIGGAEKIGKLFGDQQVLGFLLPMMANLDRYQQIAGAMGNASPADTGRDLQSRLAGDQAQLDRFGEIGEQAIRRIGRAFATNLPMINAGLTALLGWIAAVDARWPGLIDTALSWAGAGLLVTAGLAALGPAAAIASAALGVLGSALAVVLSPIGAVAAALGAVAYVIYSDWAGFAPLFERVWGGITAGAQGWVQYMRALFTGDWSGMQAGLAAMRDGAGRALTGTLDILRRISADMIALLDDLTGGIASKVTAVIFGAMTAIGAAVSTIAGRIGASLSTVTGSVSEWAGGVPAKIAAAIGDGADTTLAAARDLATKAVTALIDGWADLGPKIAAKITDAVSAMAGMDASAWSDLGKRFGDAVVDAVKSAIDRLVQWFAELPNRIVAAIGSIDLSNLIQWPSLPSWLGGGGSAAAAPAAASPAAAAAPAQRVDVGGDITVRATGGSEVTSARSRGPVPFTTSPNRGLVQGRP
ncbi:phage tail tape measure protein [Segnochrobactrum spirostomi]|uniref:Phage tail tape measure protein n=1 Tax=Segnochrobactrum spirostomi TaxID=2608987 RepID=A0A6A7Y6Q7_9HYPH|nr:phage tail tape measure protein [Segnochrobactrum spirostomi]MQT14385.1 phage tail tape measure protein [Segnochrobactrum spirostomi]